MGLLDELLGGGGSGAVSQIAKQLGIPDDKAKQAASALAPALSRGLKKNAEKPGGLESLLGALNSGKHEKYVDNPEVVSRPETVEDGNKILGHILGSKDVSRNVAGAASKQTGLDAGILKKMLPMLAPVVMGALAKQTKGGDGSPLGGLSGLTGGSGGGAASDAGGLGALAGFLDADKDGDSTDDLLNLAKKFF